MRQVKIFSGRSLKIEDNINKWIKENQNYNIVDIKMFRTEDFIYSLVIYEVKK